MRGSAAERADAWLQTGADAHSGPEAQHLFIEDGADGCWVTFAADAAGQRVPIGRGANSKVCISA